MIQKAAGIVFRSIRYSETSLIVDIYTEEFGLLSCIVSGVRKVKAKMHANTFQIMNILDFVFYDRTSSKSLRRIKEAKTSHIYSKIPYSIERLAVGQFIIEVLQKTIREREANPTLYRFISDSFFYLDQAGTHELKYYHLRFLYYLSRHLGFEPGNNWSDAHPFFDLQEGIFVSDPMQSNYVLNRTESRMLFEFFRRSETEEALDLSKSERHVILQQMLVFYKLHVDKFPDIQSSEILKQVFS